MTQSRILFITLLAIIAAGCTGPRPADSGEEPIGVGEFADVYIELRRAAVASDSAAEFEARKAEILERHGLTDADLIGYVERRSDDLKGLAATWDTIYRRIGRWSDSTEQRGQ